jgi:hypothetical protein
LRATLAAEMPQRARFLANEHALTKLCTQTHTQEREREMAEDAAFRARWEANRDQHVALRARVLQRAPLCTQVNLLADLCRIAADYAEPRCVDARAGDGQPHDAWLINCELCHQPLCVSCAQGADLACAGAHILCQQCRSHPLRAKCGWCNGDVSLCTRCLQGPMKCRRRQHWMCRTCDHMRRDCYQCAVEGIVSAFATYKALQSVKRQRVSQ